MANLTKIYTTEEWNIKIKLLIFNKISKTGRKRIFLIRLLIEIKFGTVPLQLKENMTELELEKYAVLSMLTNNPSAHHIEICWLNST